MITWACYWMVGYLMKKGGNLENLVFLMRNKFLYDFLGKWQRNPCDNVSRYKYPPSSSIVVQVHEGSRIPLLLLFSINKCLGELDGMVHVVTTASPIKGPFGIMWRALFSRVTGAGVQLALTAGSGQCVDHACWGDGIHKGCLTTACEHEKVKCEL